MNALKTRARMRGQGGFTLIELLIVIAILGILAGVVVYAVGGTTDNAKTQACKTEKSTIETAAEAYKAEPGNTGYPADFTAFSPKFLKEAPSTTDWTYTASSGTVVPAGATGKTIATAATGGKYKGLGTDCVKPTA